MQELVSTVCRDGVIDQYIEPNEQITCSPKVSKNFYIHLSSQKNQMKKLQVKKKNVYKNKSFILKQKWIFFCYYRVMLNTEEPYKLRSLFPYLTLLLSLGVLKK